MINKKTAFSLLTKMDLSDFGNKLFNCKQDQMTVNYIEDLFAVP